MILFLRKACSSKEVFCSGRSLLFPFYSFSDSLICSISLFVNPALYLAVIASDKTLRPGRPVVSVCLLLLTADCHFLFSTCISLYLDRDLDAVLTLALLYVVRLNNCCFFPNKFTLFAERTFTVFSLSFDLACLSFVHPSQ